VIQFIILGLVRKPELEEVTETKTAMNRAKQQEKKNGSGQKDAPSDGDEALHHPDDGGLIKQRRLLGGVVSMDEEQESPLVPST
jgi:hypothetical protein